MRCPLLVAILLVPPAARADDAPPPAARRVTSIALIDMAEVFKHCDEFKERTEELKADVAATTAQMTTLTKMATDLAVALQKASTDDERARFERDVVKVQGEINTLKNVTQRDLARKEARIYKAVYARVKKTVAEVSRERGFDLVIRFSSEEIGPDDEPQMVIHKLNKLVVFNEAELDITQEVIRRLNGDGDESDDERAEP